jgi:uncharacterized protein YbaR (Trm112 family)
MKRDIEALLCCPVCKSDLSLSITRETNDEIISGKLSCHTCKTDYLIVDGIPNMLPPDKR